MTLIRNKTIREQVMYRDFHLCRCCGFKADEAHHIISLAFGGEDKPENMVALCSTCHRYAPEGEVDFIAYLRRGGANTQLLLGRIIKELEISHLDFVTYFPEAKKIIGWLRNCDIINAFENHNLLIAQQVPEAKITKDILFIDNLKKVQSNTDKKEEIVKSKKT